MSVRADAAEHEAAHVVVGLALGLKLRKAALGYFDNPQHYLDGFTWFSHGRQYLAFGVMICAGIAWERREGGNPSNAALDAKQAKQIHIYSANVETSVRLADELLRARRAAHARVARELCDRDLGPADVERLVIGE